MPCVYRRSIHVLPPLTNKPYSLPVFIESAASFTIYIILPQSLPTHKCFGVVKERRNKTGHQSQNFFQDSPPNARGFEELHNILGFKDIRRLFSTVCRVLESCCCLFEDWVLALQRKLASLSNKASLRTTEQHSIRFNCQISTYGVS